MARPNSCQPPPVPSHPAGLKPSTDSVLVAPRLADRPSGLLSFGRSIEDTTGRPAEYLVEWTIPKDSGRKQTGANHDGQRRPGRRDAVLCRAGDKSQAKHRANDQIDNSNVATHFSFSRGEVCAACPFTARSP